MRFGDLVETGMDRAGFKTTDTTAVVRARSYANAELARLHRYLLKAFEDLLSDKTTINLTTTAQSYTYPEEVLKIRKIFLLNSSGQRIRELHKGRLDDLNAGETGTNTASSNKSLKWVPMARKLWLHRLPASASDKLELWYVPQFVKITDDNNDIHYMVPVDWEDFLLEGVAARMLEWEESDSKPQRARQLEIKAEILASVEDKVIGEPEVVRDVHNRFGGGRSDFWD